MSLSFSRIPGSFAIARLAADAAIPSELLAAPGFLSITRTLDELSLVCLDAYAHDIPQKDLGWSCIKIHGPFAFDQVGILASLLNPLASASIGIFALSTYDTDYVLVKSENLDNAVQVLINSGHKLVG